MFTFYKPRQRAEGFCPHDRSRLKETARQMGQLLEHASVVSQQPQQSLTEEALTILAHDLHNALTPLKTRLEMVERRARQEDRTRDLRDLSLALSSLNRFNQMISDLLDIARLKQGLFSITPHPLNLVDLVQGTVLAFEFPQIPIHVRTQKPVLTVCADPERLRQILENLLSNAITHAPTQTPVEVIIQTEEHQNGNQVQVKVSNQGLGIPPEIQAQLFEPFVAGSASKGLGLGLYVASRLAQAHRGCLSAASLPEGGAAFTLSLPLLSRDHTGPGDVWNTQEGGKP